MVEELRDYLDDPDIHAELHETRKEVKTVQDAAEALQVEPTKIIKSLVFFIDGKPYLVIGIGDEQIDEEKLKRVLGADKIRIASPEEVKEMTGYSIGKVPPIGNDLPKVVELRVMDKEIVYGGGGSIRHLLEVDPSELVGRDTIVADIQS